MLKLGRAWIHRQLEDGELIAEGKVQRFALRLSLKSMVVANVVNFALQIVLDALGLLPYPLSQALTVGLIATTIITLVVTYMFGLLIGRAIYDLSISRDAFARLSSVDPLSGLLNRRAFFAAVTEFKEDAVFILFDIDYFKAINDTHGHAVGDEAIRSVGAVLCAVFTNAGTKIARIGGEEFSVVMTKDPGDKHADLAEAARVRISDMRVGTGSVRMTISAGAAEFPIGRDIAQVYAAADNALYLAKSTGRDRIVYERDASQSTRICPVSRAAA